MLSNLLRNIYLYRYDTRTRNIYILAGRGEDEAEQLPMIEIYPNGSWEFING